VPRAPNCSPPKLWPAMHRVVVERAASGDCRPLIAEVSTPWRADAILANGLRCGFDALDARLGVTAKR
jgi:hypothetical protein